jgi:excinuclease UvrABC ATPase subunit
MLYSRAGDYPAGQGIIYAESFSPNTPEGACPECHGLRRVYQVNEQTMVWDDSLTIRGKAIASWPSAWQGQNHARCYVRHTMAHTQSQLMKKRVLQIHTEQLMPALPWQAVATGIFVD